VDLYLNMCFVVRICLWFIGLTTAVSRQ